MFALIVLSLSRPLSRLLCCHLGTLHVGDEIREINGASVQGQSVEKLQKLLVSVSVSFICQCQQLFIV